MSEAENWVECKKTLGQDKRINLFIQNIPNIIL